MGELKNTRKTPSNSQGSFKEDKEIYKDLRVTFYKVVMGKRSEGVPDTKKEKQLAELDKFFNIKDELTIT